MVSVPFHIGAVFSFNKKKKRFTVRFLFLCFMYSVPFASSTRYRFQISHPGIPRPSPSFGWYNNNANTYDQYDWSNNFATANPQYANFYDHGLTTTAAGLVIANGPGAMGTGHAELRSFIAALDGDCDFNRLGEVTEAALSRWNQLRAAGDSVGRYLQQLAPHMHVGAFPFQGYPFNLIARYVGFTSYTDMAALVVYQCIGYVVFLLHFLTLSIYDCSGNVRRRNVVYFVCIQCFWRALLPRRRTR